MPKTMVYFGKLAMLHLTVTMSCSLDAFAEQHESIKVLCKPLTLPMVIIR